MTTLKIKFYNVTPLVSPNTVKPNNIFHHIINVILFGISRFLQLKELMTSFLITHLV